MRKGKRALSDQQLELVNAYFMLNFKKGKALIAAGYSETTARNNPQKIFEHPAVVDEIARRKAVRAEKAECSEEWLMQQWMKRATAGERLAKYKMVDGDGQIYYDFTDAPQEDLALVSDISFEIINVGRGEAATEIARVKYKIPDEHAALIALARHTGFFNEDQANTGLSLEERIQAGRDRAYKKPADKSNGVSAS